MTEASKGLASSSEWIQEETTGIFIWFFSFLSFFFFCSFCLFFKWLGRTPTTENAISQTQRLCSDNPSNNSPFFYTLFSGFTNLAWSSFVQQPSSTSLLSLLYTLFSLNVQVTEWLLCQEEILCIQTPNSQLVLLCNYRHWYNNLQCIRSVAYCVTLL